jgi:hypothetical protein
MLKEPKIIMIITKDRWKVNEDIEISYIYETLVHNNILFKIFKTFEHKLKTWIECIYNIGFWLKFFSYMDTSITTILDQKMYMVPLRSSCLPFEL